MFLGVDAISRYIVEQKNLETEITDGLVVYEVGDEIIEGKDLNNTKVYDVDNGMSIISN
jgi:hypothetical protein